MREVVDIGVEWNKWYADTRDNHTNHLVEFCYEMLSKLGKYPDVFPEEIIICENELGIELRLIESGKI